TCVLRVQDPGDRMPSAWSKENDAMRALLSFAVAGISALGLLGAGPPAVRAATPADRPALIDVQVPAGAEIWFDGARTSQTGPFRQFISPPLTPGRQYAYAVRVRWTEGGRTVERTRRLGLRAGDRVSVDFAGSGSDETRALYYVPETQR